MSNTIVGLRADLFATLRGLKDGTIDIDRARARAITDVGQAIIASAKVEVDYIKAVGDGASSFLDSEESKAPRLGRPEIERTGNGLKTITHVNGATITRHKMEI